MKQVEGSKFRFTNWPISNGPTHPHTFRWH